MKDSNPWSFSQCLFRMHLGMHCDPYNSYKQDPCHSDDRWKWLPSSNGGMWS